MTSAVLDSGENLAKDLISTPAPYHIAEALAKYGYAFVKQGLIPTAEQTQAVENVPTKPEDPVLAQNELTKNRIRNAQICQQHWYLTEKNSYYFTPYGFSQEIYGIEGDYRDQVTESPQFLNMKIEEANRLLQSESGIKPIGDEETIISHPEKFKAATRAMAITIASETFKKNQGSTAQHDHPELIKFLAIESDKAQQLSKIIKLVDNVCLHLQLRRAMKTSVTKRHLIEENSNRFKQKIFLACYAYLNKHKTSDDDEKCLINEINAAKSEFLSIALSKDRGYLSWALRPIGKMIGALFLLPQKLYAMVSGQSNATQQESINFFSVRSKKLVQELKNQIVAESIPSATKPPK